MTSEPRDSSPASKLVDGSFRAVYAYIVLPESGRFVALAKDGAWTLPGGLVEGEGAPDAAAVSCRVERDTAQDAPDESKRMTEAHTPLLAWYVKEQTGLDLASIGDPAAVRNFEGERGPSMSVLYYGEAKGELLGGELIDPKAIWEFHPTVPLDVKRLQEFFGVYRPTLRERIVGWATQLIGRKR